MTNKKCLVHAIVDCKDCGWHYENYLYAQERARKHAVSRGHRVLLDLGYVVCYDGKLPAKKEERK